MPLGEVLERKKELLSQYKVLGVPTESELHGSENAVYVESYTRDDGTEVKGYWRSKPEGSFAGDNQDNTDEGINPAEPVKENYDEQGTVTGGASDTNKMNVKEKIQEFAYEKGLSKIFPMSSDATVNGMHDMEAARNDKNATVTRGLNAVESEKNKNYLKSMGARDTDRGVIYNEHSDIANNFKNSPELEEHLVKIQNDVLQGKQLQDTKITFDSNKNDFINNNEKIDRHAFIHKAMLVDQKVDDNGIYSAKILDYSNFEDKPIEELLDIPNKWGYDMQERGLYKNYYIVINIRKKVNW